MVEKGPVKGVWLLVGDGEAGACCFVGVVGN